MIIFPDLAGFMVLSIVSPSYYCFQNNGLHTTTDVSVSRRPFLAWLSISLGFGSCLDSKNILRNETYWLLLLLPSPKFLEVELPENCYG